MNTLRDNSGRILRAALVGATALVALLPACNIVTPASYIINGPGKIDAEYTLADRKTVVFVDDPDNILDKVATRVALADAIGFDLMDRGILTSTVKAADAIAVARTGGNGGVGGKLMSVEAIGRAVDCAQVIHIQPTIFDLVGRSDTQGLRPTGIVFVKVVDIEAKRVLYPLPDVLPDGREITATIRETDSDLLRSRTGRAQVSDQLVKKLAVEVAQLFYEHDRLDLGENLGTRRR
jgi:hypothetical protein